MREERGEITCCVLANKSGGEKKKLGERKRERSMLKKEKKKKRVSLHRRIRQSHVQIRYKGGKGLGKGSAKHHHKVLNSDNIQGIMKHVVRRLARRGGMKRISSLINEETRGVVKVFFENVIHDVVTNTKHAHRKTVVAMDVVCALKQ